MLFFLIGLKRTSCPAVLFDVNRNDRNVPKLDPQIILCFLSCFIINRHCCLFIYHTRTLSVVSCPAVCGVQTWFSACWLNVGATEFGQNSIYSLCNEEWIHAFLLTATRRSILPHFTFVVSLLLSREELQRQRLFVSQMVGDFSVM